MDCQPLPLRGRVASRSDDGEGKAGETMRTVNELYEAMQRIAPLELAESWDNPGLLVNCCRPVDRVLVTLDITPDVVEEAAAKGCGLIVAHHPVIFSPLKRLAPKDVPFQLVQNGISAICMHRGYFYLIPQWDKIELNQMNGNNLMQVPRPE